MKTNVLYMIAGGLIIALLSACGVNVGLGNAANLPRISGSGNVVNETRNVSGFDGVVVNGVGNIQIDQTGNESLTISADDNLLPYITTEARGGKLYIDFKPVLFDKFKDLTFKITAKNFNSLDLNGAASVEGKNLAGERLAVKLSGAGSINLSGKVTEQQVTLDGLGSYNSKNLESQRATVTQNGTGSAVVNVSDKLDAKINGLGSIEYIGNPQVTKSVNGMGAVRQIK